MNRSTTRVADQPPRELARSGRQGLALRSATLVRRGLRDLARESNWLIQKVFSESVPHAAISNDGRVCIPSGSERDGTHGSAVLDLEGRAPAFTLSVPLQASPARIAWSGDGRHLLVAGNTESDGLHLIDVRRQMISGSLGSVVGAPSELAWSPSGSLVASAIAGKEPSLALWRVSDHFADTQQKPLHQLAAPNWVERRGDEADSSGADAGEFAGYGRLAFSPDESMLAAVVHFDGDWADDLIALLNVPALEKQTVFEAQGHVTDIAWSGDSKRIVYCSAGQAYGTDLASAESTPLPFGGERCAWHPHLPICLFYSSWLRNSAKGRLFLADMDHMRVFDEHPADDVIDLRWSADGAKAYAVTSEGLAYIYEPELL